MRNFKWIQIAIFIFPLTIFAKVAESKYYQGLKREVDKTYQHQIDIIEENQKLISQTIIYNSPERIDRLAEKEFNLKKILPYSILRIILPQKISNP